MRRVSNYPIIPSAPLQKMELIDYSKGINTFEANDILPENMFRLANDARISTLGRYMTRKGLDAYSTPAGETLNATQTSTTGAADSNFGLNIWLAQKFTATAAGRLTKVDLNLKTTNGSGTIIIEIRADNAGSPALTSLASSSIAAVNVLTTYSYLSAKFIEAPQMANGSSYWIVAYMQDDSLNSFNWSSTTNASNAQTSTTSGTNWSALGYDLNFKTYISTDGGVLGLYRAYKSDGTKKSLLAQATSLYTVNDITGALTAIKTGLSSIATDYRFATANDTVYYVNGIDAPRKWNFTTEAANPGTTTVSSNIILHKDQMFYVDKTNPTRMYFSDKTAYETFTSTNFFYVPTPQSADAITGLAILNDNLIIWTKRTKWVLFGSDLTNFVLRKSTGLKGCLSQDQIQATRNHAYFVSDVGVFRFNGAMDELISEAITDEFNSIADKTKITTALANNRFYMFYTPSGGGVNSKCLVYNINYGSWESIDLNTYVGKCVYWDGPGDSNELVQGSNLVGAAYYAEKTSNNYSNLGKALNFELRTKYEFFGNPASKKRIKRWYPRFAAQTNAFNVTCSYDKDFNGTATDTLVATQSGGTTWGSSALWGGGKVWGSSTLVTPRLSVSGRAKYLQFRVSRKGVNNPVEFYGHTLLYFVQRPR